MTGEAVLMELRKEIAAVTLEILRLCGERARIAEKIGDFKARKNIPVENSEVEEELREMVLEVCRTSRVDTGFCEKFLDLLVDESKRIQRDMIGFGS